MHKKTLPLLVFAGLMTACSPSDFFLGEDNRPQPKDLPELVNNIGAQVLWSSQLGEGGEEASLALAPDGDGRTVYAVSADGKVSAFDIASGNKKFTRDLDKTITAGVRYSNGMLLLGTGNGELMALAANSGDVVWRANVGGAILARPAASGNMVIVRSQDGRVNAYNIADGVQIWQYRISDPSLSIRGYSEPVIGGGVVIITTDSGRFIVLDQESGLPVAEERVAVGEGLNDIQRLVDIDATPKVNQGILFGSAFQSNTFALNLQSGTQLWSQSQATTADDFAMSPDAIFLHDGIDHVYALNQQDGSIRWQNDQLEGRYLSPMIAVPGKVGSVDSEGYFHWFDINNGQLIGQSRIGSANALSEPYLGPSAIVWQLADGDIVAVKP